MDILRSLKIYNTDIALFDTAATGLLAAGVSYYHADTVVYTPLVFVIFMIIAIAVHRITNTPTMLNYYLGINDLDSVLDSRKGDV